VSWWALDASGLGSELTGTVGDMESGSGWYVFGSPVNLDYSTSKFYSGSQSLYITNCADNKGAQLQSQFTIVSGEQIYLDAWVYVVDGTKVQIGINGTTDGLFKEFTVTANTWTNITHTYTANSSISTYVLFTAEDGYDEFYVDDVTVKKVSVEDLEGSNDGVIVGATVDEDLYGGDTPVIPRAIDNARTVQADAIGAGSALFDGDDDDYIDTGLTGLTVHTNATMSYWCKMGDFTGDQRMGAHDGKRFYLGFNNGYAFFGIQNQYKLSTDISSYIATNTWIHLCLVAKDGTATYYINGIARDTFSYTQSLGTNPDTNFFIGAISNPEDLSHMNGNICQVGVWSKALDQAQIQRVMERTFEEFNADDKTDLVSYWALDDSTPALIMDGSGDYVNMGDVLDIGTDDFSVFAWIYITTLQYQGVVSKEASAGTDNWHMVIDGYNKLSGRLYIDAVTLTDGVSFGGDALSANTWYHVGITYDRSSVATGYVNGVAEPNTRDISAGDGNTFDNSDSFVIGGRNSQGGFAGHIAQVGVYNKVLSASEVLTQYNLKVEGDWSSDSGLTGYWKLDTASTSSNAITDLSTNSNHGTISGNPTLGGVVQDLKSDNDGTLI